MKGSQVYKRRYASQSLGCVATFIPLPIQCIVHQNLCEGTGFFFYLGDLWEKRDGGLLLQGIQSKWCEKTMRGILTCFFVSISFVSFHYGIHHHWLGPSLLIPTEILPPVIPCYFITSVSTGGEVLHFRQVNICLARDYVLYLHLQMHTYESYCACYAVDLRDFMIFYFNYIQIFCISIFSKVNKEKIAF